MATLDDLIKLYCQHTTSEIETDGRLLLKHFHVPDAVALLAIDGYKDAFHIVSKCSSELDLLVAKHSSTQAQVTESIRLLRDMIDKGDLSKAIEVMRKLVEGRLYKTWPAADQQMYDRKKEILEWRDFFVSYTNRDAPAMNDQYRALIRSCFGVTPKGVENKSNYVARVITRHLRRSEGLSGFFDNDDTKVGEDIQHEVDGYCKRAFALVQLIEPLALEKEPPKNWCFYEYCQFGQSVSAGGTVSGDKRHFFILAGDTLNTVRPANLVASYHEWVDRIERVRYVPLNNERNISLRAKIKTIAIEILSMRANIVDAWLAAP
jgi:hypothetical protein